jgi:cellulose biosynthesis protein BcsQ
MELLLNKIHGLLVIDLDESLATLAHGNTKVKRKCNYVLFLFIKSTNKNNKILVDVMEKINVVQLEIEQHCFENHNYNFKEHLHHVKTRNKIVHQMNKNLVNVF